MDIIVYVKQVPDVYGPLRYNPLGGQLDRESLLNIMNPFDEIALEYALRLRDNRGGTVTVVCLGKPAAREALRYCLAVGSDRCLLINEPESYESCPYAVGKVLAKATQLLEYDLILCGVQAVDDNAGVVGTVLAESLALPLVVGIMDIEGMSDTEEKVLTVHRKAGGGDREVLEVTLPAVLTIEHGPSLRYPTARSKIVASKAAIESMELTALGLSASAVADESMTKLVKLSGPRPKLTGLVVPDDSLCPAEKISYIISGGIGKKAGNRLQGEPREIAANLLQILSERNLIGRVEANPV
jgi:electron transfer flavoprotein beta subunit